MPFVQHGDRYCSWYSSDPSDQIPVKPDWWGPPEESGWPHVGECRSCGERGHTYELPPVAPEVRDNASAFAHWFREALRDHAGRPGSAFISFVPHRIEADVALMDWHGPTEVIVWDGKPLGGDPPTRVLRCRECSSAEYPCRTLRMVAAPYRFYSTGHRQEWL
jgi:hypothetical protein